jgi:ribosomal protein S18 acetylase RimI-like enzyme
MLSRMSEHHDAPSGILIDLHAGADRAGEITEVMHRAFMEYTRKGERSSAMLETPESLRREMREGTRIGVAHMRDAEAARRLDGDEESRPERQIGNRIDNHIVAMVKYRAGDGGTLYFCRLAVLPEFRGLGIAGMLVRSLRAEAWATGFAGLSCTVRAQETGNIAMYEQLGMTVVGHGHVVSATKIKRAVVHMRDAC